MSRHTVPALPKSETRKRKRRASPKLSIRKRKANSYFKLAVIEESEPRMVHYFCLLCLSFVCHCLSSALFYVPQLLFSVFPVFMSRVRCMFVWFVSFL